MKKVVLVVGVFCLHLAFAAGEAKAALSYNHRTTPMFTWVGGNSSSPNAWGQKKNWTNKDVPGGSDNVTIAAGVSQPIITTGNNYSINNAYIFNVGNLTIQGGRFTASTIVLGKDVNGTLRGGGSLNLMGGHLTAENINIASGSFTNHDAGDLKVTSAITQSGGKSTFDTLAIDNGYNNVKAYSLTGGSLTAGRIELTAGSFTKGAAGALHTTTFDQSGGTSNFGNVLSIASGMTYNLSNGALKAKQIDNDGDFNFSGSTLSSDLHNTGTLRVTGKGRQIDGDVINSGAFIQSGTMSASSYTQTGGGSTTRVDGTLKANPVNINDGTLQGNGIIKGNVTMGNGNIGDGLATLSPGNSIGTLTIDGNFTQAADGVFNVAIDNLASYDKLIISGLNRLITLGGNLLITLTGDNSINNGDTFNIISLAPGASGSVLGNFSVVEVQGGNTQFNVNLSAGKVAITAVPIPATVWLLGIGLVGLVGVKRRMGVNA